MIPRSQRMAAPVDGVAATIERALMARRPRARYVVGAGPRAQAALAALTPTPAMDALLRVAAGVPAGRADEFGERRPSEGAPDRGGR